MTVKWNPENFVTQNYKQYIPHSLLFLKNKPVNRIDHRIDYSKYWEENRTRLPYLYWFFYYSDPSTSNKTNRN